MLHLQTATSPAVVTMLLGCVLGIGFMVRFLIALTLDGKEANTQSAVRPGGLHYAAVVPRTQTPYRAAVANSASHLAIGVVRITSALASNAIRGTRRAAVDRLHVVAVGNTGREVGFTPERRYRSG